MIGVLYVNFCDHGKIKLHGLNKIVRYDDILSLLSGAYKIKNVSDVIVFRSYARGEERPEISDLDVVVIINDERTTYQQMKDFLIFVKR